MSLENRPTDTFTSVIYVAISAFVGKAELARVITARMIDVDPLQAINHYAAGFVRYFCDDPAGGLPHMARGHELGPSLPSGVNLYVQALVALGREREARDAVATLLATAPPDNLTWLAELFLWALDGRRDDIVSTLTPERVRWARADLQYSLQLAECFAMLGDNDRAFDWLENAVRCGVVNHPFLSRRDPFLSSLRRDPRFEPLMAHVKSIWQRVQGGLSRTNEPEIVPNTLLSQVVVRVGEFRPAGRHASGGTSNSYVPLGSLSETAPRFTIELAGGVYNPGTSVNFREW